MDDRQSGTDDHVDDAAGADSDTGHGLDAARIEAVRLIGHRARTPLSLVIGPISSVVSGDDVTDDDRHRLTTAIDQAERLRADLVSLTEIGRWPGTFVRRPLRLGELVADVARASYGRSSWRGVSYDISAADTRQVTTDGDRLRWALDVLVAEIASRAGPRARHVVSCEDDPLGEATIVAISADDRGVGDRVIDLAADDRDEPSHEPSVESALARRVIELLGGTVAESDDGEIRLTTIRLPSADGAPTRSDAVPPIVHRRPFPSSTRPRSVGPSEQAAHADEGQVIGPAGRPLVVVVDDDRELRGYLAQMLASDYRTVSHSSAELARPAIEQLRPDAVVCDLALPDQDGEELIASLHADPELADIPVVVITGYDDDERRVRLLRDGADDYIVKPFTVDELSARVGNLIANRLDVVGLRAQVERAQQVADQLQHALDSRVVVEQAKAFIAADRGIDVDAAFEVLRTYSRSNNTKLHAVARRVVEGFRP